MSTLREIGERALILRIARGLKSNGNVAVGIGDDCAVVRIPDSKYDLLYTTDAVIEGAHFLRRTPAGSIGHKAVARALSDIAAMGGDPQYILINLVAPKNTPIARVESIYRAASRTASRWGAVIVGGDTCAGRTLELHVFCVGRILRGRAILRAGARAGDIIYVTGQLGGSIYGKHLRFQPRLREGQWLRNWATSMIDLSDGLAIDLRHLCDQSRIGAEIDSQEIPRTRHANVRDALVDGEDYELLFTVPQKKAAAFERAWRKQFNLTCSAIGRMTAQRGIRLDGRPLASTGFEHFRPRA